MKSAIKVMHIIHALEPGGLEKGVVNITNHLNSKGFEISICCLENSGAFEKRLNHGTKVFVMNKQPGIDYLLPLRLARLFRREKTMIVHTHELGTYLYGTVGAKLALRPRIIHGEHGGLLQSSESRKKYLIVRRCLSYVTDVIHTMSADLKHALAHMTRINPGKIVTILNGVESEKFGRTSSSRSRVMLGIEPEVFVIGTVGRLSPVKNFELLIRIIPKLNHIGIHPKVLFVGDGPSRSNLESLIKKCCLEEQIIFLGNRSDVPELLSAMDIFVLPSLSEGLSNSILEAMATGIPVIASDVGGNSELVVHNETGFLFPPGDGNALSQRIAELAGNPEKRYKMGISGRRRIEESFTLEKMIQNYEQLYRNVIHNGRFGQCRESSQIPQSLR